MNNVNAVNKDKKVKLFYIRTLKDVEEILHHARLEEQKFTSVVQSLYFPPATNGDEIFWLMELNSNLLQSILEGQSLSFKGSLDENAVLCTKEKTYELKKTEISDSLLLIPYLKSGEETSLSPFRSPKLFCSIERLKNDASSEVVKKTLEQKSILKVFYEYFECREIQPRFRKLNDILMLTRYSGPENEHIIEKKFLFTFDQLLDTVQCSDKQLVEGLKRVRALKLDGFIRILDCEYEYRIISSILAIVSENAWPLKEVNKDETITALTRIAPKQIVEGAFELYTEPVEGSSQKFEFNEELLARIIALNILKPGMKFRLEEFMSTWQGALLERFNVHTKYLRGIGIIDFKSDPPCVMSLSDCNITDNFQDRIDLLFKVKTSWTLDEIEPYLEYFTTATMDVPSILTKYARSFVTDGTRHYVSKYK